MMTRGNACQPRVLRGRPSPPGMTRAREHEPPGPSSSRAPRWRSRRARRLWSADLVQPADGGTVTGVAEDLELLVPRDAEQQVDLVLERLGVAARAQDRLTQ